MRKKETTKNVLVSLLLQLVTLVNGLIVPIIILSCFGSDVNGLVSSINQFLNYITLLEGGAGAVVMSALYRPLSNGDTNKVSSVIAASNLFFRRIALIYLCYAFVLAVLGPIFIWKEFSWVFIASLVIVIAFQLFIQYYFSISYKMLLNADRKVYIVSLTSIAFLIINLAFVIIVSKVYSEIHLLKIASAIAFCVQPVVFSFYIKKHYNIDRDAKPDETALSQRWDGFGQNLAYVINVNTDITVLTFLSSLANVSVYSVYLLIVNALRNIIVAISSAILPTVANVFVRDDLKKTNKYFDLYEIVIGFSTTFVFSCGAILVRDFIMVYTKGINDANYDQPLFGILIMAAFAIATIREPFINITNAAGEFKKTAKYGYIEAGMNIILSVILVYHYGIIGVTFGTLVASIVRYILQVMYLRNHILFRSWKKAIKSLLSYCLIFCSSIMITGVLRTQIINSYWDWILSALVTAIIVLFITIITMALFYNSEFLRLIRKKTNNQSSS